MSPGASLVLRAVIKFQCTFLAMQAVFVYLSNEYCVTSYTYMHQDNEHNMIMYTY